MRPIHPDHLEPSPAAARPVPAASGSLPGESPETIRLPGRPAFDTLAVHAGQPHDERTGAAIG